MPMPCKRARPGPGSSDEFWPVSGTLWHVYEVGILYMTWKIIGMTVIKMCCIILEWSNTTHANTAPKVTDDHKNTTSNKLSLRNFRPIFMQQYQVGSAHTYTKKQSQSLVIHMNGVILQVPWHFTCTRRSFWMIPMNTDEIIKRQTNLKCITL